MTAAGNLPEEELLIDILTRCPVKSLVRFRCIHKSWNSLIKSSGFVITHSQNPKNKTHGSIFLPYDDYSGNIRSFDPNSFDVRADHLLPFDIREYRFQFSCNGLLCLHKSDTNSIVLYNPCLKQYKILPTPNHCGMDLLFGLGYDSTNNDYKVVKEHYLYWDDTFRSRTETQVYSLRRNCWRKLGSNIPDGIILSGDACNSFFDGAIHRVAYNVRNNYHGMIVSFDVCNEVFHLFSPPNCKGQFKINVNEDLLSIFDLAFKVRGQVCCDIWVMKEYGVEDSWIQLHSIKLFCPSPYGIGFLGFGMNGEIIFEQVLGQRRGLLVVSNYNNHEILIKTIKVEQRSYCAFGCIESLVSLDQGNQ